MMLLQHAAAAANPLAGTAVDRWLWLLPALPLLGFVINGLLSVFSAAHIGPADPGLPHGEPSAAEHHAAEIAHAEHAEPTGSDSHADLPNRFRGIVSVIGPLVLIASFGVAVWIFAAMLGAGEMRTPLVHRYWSWMPVGDLHLDLAFQLDQLSMVMLLIITGVGSLIHIFSIGYMRDDPGYPRFFAYLNLFVFFMLILVLGASYPVLFIGWEGVGLCSYLLIGFWYADWANDAAGLKAFIVNRIGDFGFLVAMFLLFANLGALDFVTVAQRAGSLTVGGPVVTAICLFMLLGCTGKSAQIPLYVWLPDAMAGPTPVSALIHAATMVTAGVYLVARSSFLFAIAPAASLTVAVIGAITALFAATIGLKQWDIKKVLAYSTISQLGYMFVGVGIGAYAAGIFHLMTHAFFKALLFLGSGSVIHVMHRALHATHSHEDAQDMRNMGGLRAYMPVTWIMMWIATLAIAGIPPFSGFFSKDEIVGAAFTRAQGSTLAGAHWLGIPGSVVLYAIYVIVLVAALLTAIYMTRLMLYTFHGPNRTGEEERKYLGEAPWVMTGPLVVLGVLAAAGGWLNLPALIPLGPTQLLEHWLDPVVGPATATVTAPAVEATPTTEWVLLAVSIVVAILGIALAVARLRPASLVPKREAAPEHGFEKVLADKYYVDELYEDAVIQPTVRTSRNLLWRGIDAGVIDGLFVKGSTYAARAAAWVGSQLQSGQLGTYAWVFVAGVLFFIGALTLR